MIFARTIIRIWRPALARGELSPMLVFLWLQRIMNHFRGYSRDGPGRETTLSSRQKRRSLEAMIRRNPGVGLPLLVKEIARVLGAPWLPSEHPGALEQVWEKIEAQAALDRLQRDLPGLTHICRKELEKLLDAWPSSLDHLGEAERLKLKQQARIALLVHGAHYGPGGPYERFATKGNDQFP